MRRNPNFAIVKIPENADVIRFYQLLLENGYNEVSFVNEVRENAFLPYSGIEMADTERNDLLNRTPKIRLQNETRLQKDVSNDVPIKLGPTSANAFNNASSLLLAMDKMLFSTGITSVDHSDKKINISVGSTIDEILSAALQRRDACAPSRSPSPLSINPMGTDPIVDIQGTVLAQLMNSPLETNNNRRASDKSSQKSDLSLSIKADADVSSQRNGEINISTNGVQTQMDSTDAVLAGVTSLFSNGNNISNIANDGGDPLLNLDDDGNAYATCLLCQNRIMSSRLSNLTNHVRRHASLKQYQCTQCNYTHNEQAKVRLHMNHNHEDFNSQPVDRLCFEMQLQWNQLMEQCFPEHAKRSKDSEYWKSASTTTQSTSSKSSTTNVLKEENQRAHACTSCGEIMMRETALAHIRDRHHAACVMFSCSECGYKSTEQRYARVHASVKHANSGARIEALSPGDHELFMKRYFPTLLFTPRDDKAMDKNETFSCKLCGHAFSASSMALLVHAKKHCTSKQYRCTDCNYASTDRKSARTHIQTCHNTEREPFDAMSQKLKNAWIDTMKKCFPDLNDGYSLVECYLRRNSVKSADILSGGEFATPINEEQIKLPANGRLTHRRFSKRPKITTNADNNNYNSVLTPRETLKLLCANSINLEDQSCSNTLPVTSSDPLTSNDPSSSRKDSCSSSSSIGSLGNGSGSSRRDATAQAVNAKKYGTKRLASVLMLCDSDENIMPINKAAKNKPWCSALESEDDEEDEKV